MLTFPRKLAYRTLTKIKIRITRGIFTKFGRHKVIVFDIIIQYFILFITSISIQHILCSLLPIRILYPAMPFLVSLVICPIDLLPFQVCFALWFSRYQPFKYWKMHFGIDEMRHRSFSRWNCIYPCITIRFKSNI